ncbi:MAG: helix-turn-helix transcriptional regulator [Clostridia bacterium]|nr:helix-turn-helix transcriptional regulator [Clostridia bacterium]
MSGIIGQRIKELRTKKGFTQEELGREIGITAQAVSKWERGNSPDAELLPKIAEVLGVSVNVLFGADSNEKIDSLITKELSSLPQDEAFGRAFELCWSIEMGLTGKNSLKEKFTPDILHTLHDEYGHEIFSKLLYNGGLTGARLSSDGRYFFFMPEPEGGFGQFLSDNEKAAETFAVLSDINVLSVIKYMYSRKNTPVSLSLIAEKNHLSETDAEKAMEGLCKINLAQCTEIETENGAIKAYTYSRECSLIPLLTYAKEVRSEKPLDFVTLFGRTKPLFSANPTNC